MWNKSCFESGVRGWVWKWCRVRERRWIVGVESGIVRRGGVSSCCDFVCVGVGGCGCWSRIDYCRVMEQYSLHVHLRLLDLLYHPAAGSC